MKTLFTLILIAASAYGVSARGQNHSNLPAPAVSSACPQASEMDHRHLQGVWHADLPGHGGATVLRLGQHPELAGSVRGTLDGKRISATWLGEVVEGQCGKEIRGQWMSPGADGGADGATDTSIAFVLRKQAVWQ